MAEQYISVGGRATSTTVSTTIFTAAVNSINIINAINLANTSSSSSAIVSVCWYDDSEGDDFHIIKNAELPYGSSLQVLDGPIILDEDDEIFITSNSLDVEVIISLLKIT
jgi:hypothetical protein